MFTLLVVFLLFLFTPCLNDVRLAASSESKPKVLGKIEEKTEKMPVTSNSTVVQNERAVNNVVTASLVERRKFNNHYYTKNEQHIRTKGTKLSVEDPATLSEFLGWTKSVSTKSETKNQTTTFKQRSSINKVFKTAVFGLDNEVAARTFRISMTTRNAQKWLNFKDFQKWQKLEFFSAHVKKYAKSERERRSAFHILQKNNTLINFTIKCTNPSLSCSGRCGDVMQYSTNKQLHCFCDKLCQMFGDCCYDFEDHCAQSEANSNIKNSKDSLWSCSAVAELPSHTTGIWMIGSCPKNSSKNLNYALCSAKSNKLTLKNYKDLTPVVTRDGTTFVNQHCALCNGRQTSELTFYNLGFNCDVTPPMSYSHNKSLRYLLEYCGEMRKFFQPGEGTPRRYCIDLISRCSSFLPQGSEISDNSNRTAEIEQCVNGSVGIIFSFKGNVKNKYCAKCNGLNHGVCGPKYFPSVSGRLPPPFSIIWDVAGKNKQAWKRNIRYCYYRVYDPYLDTCRPAVEISLFPKLSPFITYRVLLWIKSNETAILSTMGHDEFLTSFTRLFSVNSSQISKLQIFEKKAFKMKVIFDLSLPSPFSLGNTKSSNVKKIQAINRIIHFKDVITMYINQHKFVIFRATKKLLGCINIDKYNDSEYTFLPRNNSAIIIKRTKEIINQQHYLAKYVLKNDIWVAIGTVVVCRDHYPLICNGTIVSLNSSEYQLLVNKSIYRNVSGELFPRGTYYQVNSSVLICTNYTAVVTSYVLQKKPYELALIFLTCICMGLSVIALIFVLITYSLFSELRTIPGIMVMNLSSSILFSQVTWIIGSGLTINRWVCFAFAVLEHYLILASLLWMSIIAADTFRVFSATKSRVSNTGHRHKRQKVVRVVVVGWLSPLMVVAVCLSIDLTDTFEIGYGGSKGCWINNSYANIMFFVIPVALSLISNVILFSFTICAIRKTKKQSNVASLRSQSRKGELKVYVKIATLLGFTWVFGFGQVLVSSYLSYVFVVLHLLQGLYIATAFTFNKRIKRLYSRYFNCLRPSNRNTATEEVHKGKRFLDTASTPELCTLEDRHLSSNISMEMIVQDTRL